MLNYYKTLYKYGHDEIVIKKSRFIGHAKQIISEVDAIKFIDEINKNYRDATHNVYAYVLGENNEIQRFSDNGEPSGTAGIPVLNVIKSEGLKNAVVVVTRYFGGILLGAGGLIRAYVKSAKKAIDNALVVEKVLFRIVNVNIDYTLIGVVKSDILKNGYKINNIEYTDKVKIDVYVYVEEIKEFVEHIKNLTNGLAIVTLSNKLYLYRYNDKIME